MIKCIISKCFAVPILGPVKEKFIVHWVRKFFEYRLKMPNLSWSEQLPLFVQELNGSGNYQDWQIRQADQAVRLYFSNFLMSESSGQEIGKSSATTQLEALQSFREGLRLRNYAARTEQTYMEWVQRYFSYYNTRSTTSGKDQVCAPIWSAISSLISPLHGMSRPQRKTSPSTAS